MKVVITIVIFIILACCKNQDNIESKNIDIWYRIKFIQQYKIALDVTAKYKKTRNGKLLYNYKDLNKLNKLFPKDHIKANNGFDADYYYIYLNINKNKVIIYYDYNGLKEYEYDFNTETLKYILDDYAEKIDVPLNILHGKEDKSDMQLSGEPKKNINCKDQ